MKAKLLIATLLALPVAACSTMKVTTDAVPGAADSIAGYHTYAWLPHPAKRDTNHNPIAEAQIKQAVENNLSAKGYRRVDASDNPDFLVGWHATTQEKTQVEDVNPYYGYGWGPAFGPPVGYGGAGGPDVYVRHYEQGTLILDVVDGDSKQLV
ncbi:MAG: DUF4136 domain-containing protein, partial [Deltaproteobacteria bacterium]|nr:DUF4136 domain-containing protein [Deltaproteobacteria bacterium]